MNKFFLFLILLSITFIHEGNLFSQAKKEIKISKRVYFASNIYSLDSLNQKVLDTICKIPNIIEIIVSGYCDSIGNKESNLLLSKRRASFVKSILDACMDSNLIQTSWDGEERLIDQGRDSLSLARNRRVDIFIRFLSGNSKMIQVFTKSRNLYSDSQIVSIKGKILSDDNQLLLANVSIYNQQGKLVKRSPSNIKGEYNLNLKVQNPNDYLVLITHDSFFLNSEKLSDYLRNEERPTLKKIILKRIKSGQNFIFKNINFVGDTSQLIPSSLPLLENLYDVLSKNKNIRIQIEGHVNFPLNMREHMDKPVHTTKYHPPGCTQRQFNQWLSDERAETIKRYLVNKGINPERIKTLGFGSSQMLFPNPINEEQNELNRRVEIRIL